MFTQVVPASYNPGEEADVYVLFVAFCCCCSVLRVHLGSSVSHSTWEEAVACVLLLCSVLRVHLGSSVSHRTWEEAVACVLLLCSVVLAVVRC